MLAEVSCVGGETMTAEVEVRQEVATTFRRLVDAWRETRDPLSSRVNDLIENNAYQQIVALGWPAVPFILRELEQELASAEGPDFWFPALKLITGEDPAPANSRGRIEPMAEAWINWGKKKITEGKHVAGADLS
jgi:hypothetical protein